MNAAGENETRFKKFLKHRGEYLALSMKPDETGKYLFIQSKRDGEREETLVDDLIEGFDRFTELRNELGYKLFPSSPDGVIAIHPEGE